GHLGGALHRGDEGGGERRGAGPAGEGERAGERRPGRVVGWTCTAGCGGRGPSGSRLPGCLCGRAAAAGLSALDGSRDPRQPAHQLELFPPRPPDLRALRGAAAPVGGGRTPAESSQSPGGLLTRLRERLSPGCTPVSDPAVPGRAAEPSWRTLLPVVTAGAGRCRPCSRRKSAPGRSPAGRT